MLDEELWGIVVLSIQLCYSEINIKDKEVKSLEKLKDLIHDYSDLLLAAVITAAMVFVVFWNLNTIFEEPAGSSAAASQNSETTDSDDTPEEDSDLVVIDLSGENTRSDETQDTGEAEATDETPGVSTPTTDTVTVNIPSGTPGIGIANILAEQGLIAEPGTFVQAAEELNLALNLKSGTYDIPRDASPEQMVRIIAGQE